MDASILQEVCTAIGADLGPARGLLRARAPFVPAPREKRRSPPLRVQFEIFARDGYIDRYSGKRLVFPGVLRLLSTLMPEEFPYHPNWKFGECHIAYWQLCPTLDHVVPIARGGADETANIVTTSMLRNSAKLSWTLEELGWKLFPPGDLSTWDGLTSWFLRFTESHPDQVSHGQIRQLRDALQIAQARQAGS